jgi:carbon monoxide dehydrogenase subunit G
VRETVDVARSPEEVYRSLTEPERGPAGAAWRDVVRDDDGYRATLQATAGPIDVEFDCRFELVERSEGERVRIRGTGLSPRLAFAFDAQLSVRAAGDGSVVDLDAEVLPAGSLAGMGQRRLGEQARRLVADFVGGASSA